MNKVKLIMLPIVFFLLLVGLLTTPKIEQHQDKIVDAIVSHVIKENKLDDTYLTRNWGRLMATPDVKQRIEYSNWVFFSITRSRENKELVTIGMFNNIIIVK